MTFMKTDCDRCRDMTCGKLAVALKVTTRSRVESPFLCFLETLCKPMLLSHVGTPEGRLGSNYARISVSKSEGHAPVFGFKGVK